MIRNYIKPQTFIKQELQILPDSDAERINAFILGPAYHLQRYTNETEREEMVGMAYSDSGDTLIAYENLPANSVVDTDFVKVYGENIETTLATLDSDDIHVLSYDQPNKLELLTSNSFIIESGYNLHTDLDNRSVQVGDRVEILATTDDRDPFVSRKTVIGFEREEIASSVDSTKTTFVKDLVGTEFSDITSSSSFVSGEGVVLNNLNPWTKFVYQNNLESRYDNYWGQKLYIEIKDIYDEGLDTKITYSLWDQSNTWIDNNGVATVDKSGNPWSATLVLSNGLDVTLHLYVSALTKDSVKGARLSFVVKGVYSAPTVALTEPCDFLVETASGIDFKSDKDRVYMMTVVPSTYDTTSDLTVGGEIDRFVTTLRIFDTGGKAPEDIVIRGSAKFSETDVSSPETHILGSTGLQLTISADFLNARKTKNPTLIAGDTIKVGIKGSSLSGVTNKLILSGNALNSALFSDITNTNITVKIKKSYKGEIPQYNSDSRQWIANSGNVTVAAGLKLYEPSLDKWLTVDVTDKARLFVSYRSYLPYSITDGIVRISNTLDIENYAGKIDPDNTLAYGLSWAIRGAQNSKAVFAAKTENNSVEAYSAVLAEASTSDVLYAFVPLTYDPAVLNTVASHIADQSRESKKRWRGGYFGTKPPAEYAKVTINDSETELQGTIENVNVNGALLSILRLSDVVLTDYAVQVGDKVRFSFYEKPDGSGELVYSELSILTVDDVDECTLDGQVASGSITNPVKIEVWAADTGYNKALWLINNSEAFGTRRVKQIWCDSPDYISNQFGTFNIEPYFIACEIAGIRSVLPVQMGLTRTEVSSVSRCPLMYRKYKEEELDMAAAGGTFIITQDYNSSPVYIRHQLTTETDKGSLYYEDSITVNHDSISYGIKDILGPYIGRRNANYETAKEIYNRIDEYLSGLLVNTENLPIGPQISGFKDLNVSVDKLRKDTINASVDIQYSLPLNYIYKTLKASVSNEEISITE